MITIAVVLLLLAAVIQLLSLASDQFQAITMQLVAYCCYAAGIAVLVIRCAVAVWPELNGW